MGGDWESVNGELEDRSLDLASARFTAALKKDKSYYWYDNLLNTCTVLLKLALFSD
jgi:hypothetical protein